MDELLSLAKLVDAVRPWRNDLVFVGGWAHRLYRFDSRATVPAYRPLATNDADLAFDSGARIQGNIADALRAASFTEVLSGDHNPPVSEYRLGNEHGAFYAEFLTPLAGSGVRRDGTADATMQKAGVTTQKLRHLDVLLVKPWALTLPASGDIPVSTPATIRIANPVSFVVQKLMIRSTRLPAKRSQDLLYIHDTLELFAADLDRLRDDWTNAIASTLQRDERKTVERERRKLFGTLTDDVRNAARIPADRTLDAEEFRKRCEYGLDQILVQH